MASDSNSFNITLNIIPQVTQEQYQPYLFPLERLSSPFGIPAVQFPALSTDQFVRSTLMQDTPESGVIARDLVFIPSSQVVYSTVAPPFTSIQEPQYTCIQEEPLPESPEKKAKITKSPQSSPHPESPDVPSPISPKSPNITNKLRKKWSDSEKKLFHTLYQSLSSQYEIIRPKLIQRKLAESKCLVTRDQAASYLQKYRMKLKKNHDSHP